MNSLNRVSLIVKEMGDTSGRIDKESILKSNIDDELLKKVLEYTYNPYKVYNVGKKTLEGMIDLPTTMIKSKFKDIFELLDFLSVNNINNEIKADIATFISATPPQLRELYIQMMLKDLRLGATASTINKVFKGLIPEFKLMLGKKYSDRADKILGEEIIITLKLDGSRLAILKDGNDIKCLTRQNKVVDGLIEIEKEMECLPDGMYDGELLKINTENLDSKDLFAETMKVSRRKGEKTGLTFNVFDYMPLQEFKIGKSTRSAIKRKRIISDIMRMCTPEFIKEVEILEITKDHSRIQYWLDDSMDKGYEGIMINLDKPYESKRSNYLLKVKAFMTMDLEITGFEEGDGRLKGTLGRVNVDYRGCKLGVGSGFTDLERKEIYENQDKYLGRIMEVNYFEQTTSQTGNYGLRFPTFSCIREKSKEVSYD